MKDRPSEIERAFQLAQSGTKSVSDIKKQLSGEGYTATQIDGPLLIKQLRELIRESAAALPPTAGKIPPKEEAPRHRRK